jgi:two-component system chemotaxis response regulator CheY
MWQIRRSDGHCCSKAVMGTGLLVALISQRGCKQFRKGGADMPVRVLIVDDSVFIRDVLRHHLECIGCAVVAEAENTMQALDLFRTVAPTLVTMDVAVPRRGGIGAMALFRIMRNESPGIPIMVVSASAYPEIRKAFLREGALDYIMKPFDALSFKQVCNRLWGTFPELSPSTRSARPQLRLSARA